MVRAAACLHGNQAARRQLRDPDPARALHPSERAHGHPGARPLLAERHRRHVAVVGRARHERHEQQVREHVLEREPVLGYDADRTAFLSLALEMNGYDAVRGGRFLEAGRQRLEAMGEVEELKDEKN